MFSFSHMKLSGRFAAVRNILVSTTREGPREGQRRSVRIDGPKTVVENRPGSFCADVMATFLTGMRCLVQLPSRLV